MFFPIQSQDSAKAPTYAAEGEEGRGLGKRFFALLRRGGKSKHASAGKFFAEGFGRNYAEMQLPASPMFPTARTPVHPDLPNAVFHRMSFRTQQCMPCAEGSSVDWEAACAQLREEEYRGLCLSASPTLRLSDSPTLRSASPPLQLWASPSRRRRRSRWLSLIHI